MEQIVKDIIIQYGSSVLCADVFRETFEQEHHFQTTVGEHILGVTAEAVKFCLRFEMTDDETLSNVVTSCLCHDISLAGRDGKYQNKYETLVRHPKDSAQIYKELTGENEERVLDAIRSHMFPLKLSVPRHREGWILTLADKISSSMDIMKIVPVTAEECEEIIRLASEKEAEKRLTSEKEAEKSLTTEKKEAEKSLTSEKEAEKKTGRREVNEEKPDGGNES